METATSLPVLRLASDPLCPYVQRAVILAAEKGIAIERRVVDLAAKPAWFTALSPTGKVPLLEVDDEVLFESAPIVEFLDEISPGSLHPDGPLARARHRAWIEFASGTLSDIAGLYNAPDSAAFEAKRRRLAERFSEVEVAIRPGPWFDGDRFHIVDAVWGPVFRYFDTIDPVLVPGLFAGRPKVQAWRRALARRPSVRNAVGGDYPVRLVEFLLRRNSYLATRLAGV